MLPVGPTGYGNSPYQSFSSFAGNPYFIDPDMLCEDDILNKEDLPDTVPEGEKIDYGKIYFSRRKTDGYKLPEVPAREGEENDIAYGYRLLQACAQKRGMRISGGEFDTERMSRVLLDEYRSGKLGRFTLEIPQA